MSRGREIINLLKRVWRFGPFVPLSSVMLAVCGSRLPEKAVTTIHEKRNAKIKKVLSSIFANHKPKTKDPYREPSACDHTSWKRTTRSCEAAASIDHQPATIWVMWLQGETEMPRLVKACLNSIRANNGVHPVVVLDKDNYRQYVTLAPKVEQLYASGALKAAHFADILRINLLAQQGGLWLDATTMLTAPLGDEVWEKPFFTIKTDRHGHFVSRCRWTVFCLGAEAGFPLIQELSEMLDMYFEKESIIVDYFMLDHLIDLLYQENAEIRMAIDSLPKSHPQLYALNKLLTSDFDEKGYEALTADTSIFKLDRKAYSDEALAANTHSYFAYLEKKYER